MGLLIYGLVNSAILAVTAVGFSFTFGISGIANFAYGGLYVLGAYLCWGLFSQLGLPYFLAVILSLIAMGALGYGLYWLVLLRVRGIQLSEAIATFGLGVMILELLRWLGFIGFHYNLPVFVEGSVGIGGVFVDYHRLAIIGVALALVAFLWFFSHHTKIGLACRGIAQEERTALSLGINSDFTAALSVALGAALAVLAAIAILPTGTILIDKGYDVLIFALAVGLVGGLESTLGVILASFILGFAQTAAALYVGTHWMMLVILAAIIIVLAIKPSGLLGKFKELEERV
jgi:branched-chain amino acid transport system permease protein